MSVGWLVGRLVPILFIIENLMDLVFGFFFYHETFLSFLIFNFCCKFWVSFFLSFFLLIYNWLCPSVGRLVGRSVGQLVGWSVGRSRESREWRPKKKIFFKREALQSICCFFHRRSVGRSIGGLVGRPPRNAPSSGYPFTGHNLVVNLMLNPNINIKICSGVKICHCASVLCGVPLPVYEFFSFQCFVPYMCQKNDQ